MKWWFIRWIYVIRTYRNYAADLNRRAEVEGVLLDAWKGKRPLPTQQQCYELAMKLGVPNGR